MVLTRRQKKEQDQLDILLSKDITVDTDTDTETDSWLPLYCRGLHTKEFNITNVKDKDMYNCALILCTMKSDVRKENIKKTLNMYTKRIMEALK